MENSLELPRHWRSPGEDGYRTPTIEDAERAVSIGSNEYPFPPITSREAHTSALGAINDRGSSFRPVTSNSEKKSVSDNLAGVDHAYPTRVSSERSNKLSWRRRIRHFTWAYFTLTMATGGIANVLHTVPFRFRGLETIGVVVFLLNIFFYLCIWAMLITRFCLYPYTFKASFMHPTESLFVPAAVVSFGTILINISQYGPDHTGRWLLETVEILFWIDATLAVIFSAGIYLLVWSTQTFTIAQMTPIWIFPAYPLLIIGPHAGNLSAILEPSHSLRVIIGGTTIQGVGFLMSLTVYAAFIYRLMTQKLPKENVRPGMFVSVGPSAFTVAGIVNMAANAKRSFPPDFMGDGELAANILRVVANFSSLWLWGLAIFFFWIATFAHVSAIGPGRMIFSMAWFSFVFPNTALVTATFAIGKAFACKPIEIIGCVMTIILILMYFFVFYMMLRAVKLRHILWPQVGEDKDEGGFQVKELNPHSPGENTPV